VHDLDAAAKRLDAKYAAAVKQQETR